MLAVATSRASLCMQVTLTVPFLLIALGSMVGRAKVIMLPEVKRMLMGCPSSWTWMLGRLFKRMLMGCPSSWTWMLGRLLSRVQWTTQPISQGFLVGPRVADSAAVSMGLSWQGVGAIQVHSMPGPGEAVRNPESLGKAQDLLTLVWLGCILGYP